VAPYDLELPIRWKNARWKVKIRDNEALEPPHVTVLRGPDAWRIGLRDGAFLDGGSWHDLPDEVRAVVLAHWEDLRRAWDERFPGNPVEGQKDE